MHTSPAKPDNAPSGIAGGAGMAGSTNPSCRNAAAICGAAALSRSGRTSTVPGSRSTGPNVAKVAVIARATATTSAVSANWRVMQAATSSSSTSVGSAASGTA